MADDGSGGRPYGSTMTSSIFAPPERRADGELAAPSGDAVSLRRPQRWPVRVAAVLIVATACALNRSGAFVIVVLFVVVVPFEKMFPRHRQPVRRPHLRTDICYGLAAPALTGVSLVVGVVIGVASLAWLPGLALRPLVGALPTGVRLVSGVLLFDCTVYWVHRFSHEVPFLWRFHSVHHSTRHLDWVSGLRNHPLDGALFAPPFVFLAACGFRLQLVVVLTVVQGVLGLFLHANVSWRWRPLQRVVITPEFHHWHHSSESDAVNTNYSAFLPVSDLVFGTYFMPSDRRPQRYGINEPMPSGMVNQLRYPFVGLATLRRLFLFCLRHPLRATAHLARSVRRGLRQMRVVARRPHR